MIEIPDQKTIIAAYGEQMQSVVAMEECAELIQAISKIHRKDCAPNWDNLVEEMADVLIMIEQLKSIYDINDMIFRK